MQIDVNSICTFFYAFGSYYNAKKQIPITDGVNTSFVIADIVGETDLSQSKITIPALNGNSFDLTYFVGSTLAPKAIYWIGDYKNNGKEWRPVKNPTEVKSTSK